MVEVICLYIITLASVVYMASKLYEFVKADDMKMRIYVIPVIKPCEFEKGKTKKKGKK